MKKAIISVMSVITAVVVGYSVPAGIPDVGVSAVYAEPEDNAQTANTENTENTENTSAGNDRENGETETRTSAKGTSVSSSETSDEELAQKVQLSAGSMKTFPLKISTGAKNGYIKIVHDDDIKIEILSPSGLPSSDQNIQKDGSATIINLVSPAMGEWKINMTSETDQEVSVIPHMDYEIKILLKTSSNVVEVGDDKRYIAEITGDGTNVDLKGLNVKLRIKGNSGTETKEMLYINGNYECTYKADSAEKKTMTALVQYKNDTIESEPIDVVVLESTAQKSNVPLIILTVLICIPIAVILALFLKFKDKIKNKMELRPLTGSIGVSVIVNNISQPEEIIELEEYGKTESLYNIVQKRALLDLQEVIISGLETGMKVVNKGGCCVRFSHVSSNNAGVPLIYGQAFKVFMNDNRTEVYIRYIEPEIDEIEAVEEEIQEKSSLTSKIPLLSKFRKEKYALPEKEELPMYYTNANALAARKAEEDAVRESGDESLFINLTKPSEEDNSAESGNESNIIRLDKTESPDAGENTVISLAKPEQAEEKIEEARNPFEFISLDDNDNDKGEEESGNSAFSFIPLDEPVSVEEDDKETGTLDLGIPMNEEEKSEDAATENASNPFDFIDIGEPEKTEKPEEKEAEVSLDDVENSNPFDFIDIGEPEKTEEKEAEVSLDDVENSNPFEFINIGEPEKTEEKEPEVSLDDVESSNPFDFINIGEPEKKEEKEPEVSLSDVESSNPFDFINIGEPEKTEEKEPEVSPDEAEDSNPFDFLNIGKPEKPEEKKPAEVSLGDANDNDRFEFINIGMPEKPEEKKSGAFDDENDNDKFEFINIGMPEKPEEKKSEVSPDNAENSNPFSFINFDSDDDITFIEDNDDVTDIKDIDVPDFVGKNKERKKDDDTIDDIPVTFLTNMTFGNMDDDEK